MRQSYPRNVGGYTIESWNLSFYWGFGVQAEQEIDAVVPNKDTTSVGKIPNAPKMVPLALLEESHYTEGLRTLKDRNSGKNAVIDEASLVNSLTEEKKSSAPSAQKELIEVSCEESASGIIFIVTTLSPVVKESKNFENALRFNWINKNGLVERENQTEICSAGGITLEASGNLLGVTLKLPAQALSNSNFIVLNRPNRVVLTVNSE